MKDKELRNKQKEDKKKAILSLQLQLRKALATSNQEEVQKIQKRINVLRGKENA